MQIIFCENLISIHIIDNNCNIEEWCLIKTTYSEPPRIWGKGDIIHWVQGKGTHNIKGCCRCKKGVPPGIELALRMASIK